MSHAWFIPMFSPEKKNNGTRSQIARDDRISMKKPSPSDFAFTVGGRWMKPGPSGSFR